MQATSTVGGHDFDDEQRRLYRDRMILNKAVMCHPERRRKGAKRVTAVVEPVGRCVASGSTMERMLFSPEILLGNASHCFAVRLRYASLRMTRAGRERGVIHCFLRDAEDCTV